MYPPPFCGHLIIDWFKDLGKNPKKKIIDQKICVTCRHNNDSSNVDKPWRTCECRLDKAVAGKFAWPGCKMVSGFGRKILRRKRPRDREDLRSYEVGSKGQSKEIWTKFCFNFGLKMWLEFMNNCTVITIAISAGPLCAFISDGKNNFVFYIVFVLLTLNVIIKVYSIGHLYDKNGVKNKPKIRHSCRSWNSGTTHDNNLLVRSIFKTC